MTTTGLAPSALYQERLRQRMIVREVVCAIIAVAAAIGYFILHKPWCLSGLIAAVVTGAAVQLWYRLAVRRAARSSAPSPGQKGV